MARKTTGAVLVRKRKRDRVYALRFSAYGARQYLTLGTSGDGWTRAKAEAELDNVLADVRRGIWQPPEPALEPTAEPERRDPTFHEFASEWYESHRDEWSGRTPEDYKWTLSNHLLPYFARHRLSEITPEVVDRYRAAKLREGKLAPNTLNKTLTRLSQIMDLAVEYGHVPSNPARGRKRRCKPHHPRRASMGAEQVNALLEAAEVNPAHRALLATAIFGGGLRVSELTGLRWRDVDLPAGTLTVAASKTEAGVRQVSMDSSLRKELAAHKLASRFTDADHYVFPGRHRGKKDGTVWDGTKRRDRGAVTRTVLYPAIERANAELKVAGKPTIPEGVTFHSLRRTYASLCAEAGIDPAWTSRQIGHVDPRFTIAVYTDVGNRRENPAERLTALVNGTSATSPAANGDESGKQPQHDLALQHVESASKGA